MAHRLSRARYSEASVTEFTHHLLPALAKAMDPECKGLPEVVGRCAAMGTSTGLKPTPLPFLVTGALEATRLCAAAAKKGKA